MPSVTILNNGGYAGLDFNHSGGFVPPDTCGAAGPTNYVETVNQTVAIFSPKSTGATEVLDSFDHFWLTVGSLPHVDNGAEFSDPIVVYDELIQRFIVGDQDVDFNTHVSNFDIAVSKTSDPTTLTTADWNFYQISTTEATYDADYPGNFGYNHDAFVFTLNMFPNSNANFHTQVVSVNSNDLATGVTPANLHVFRNDLNDFSVRPTAMHDSVAGDPMWLVTEHGDGHSIDVYKMTNILTNSATFNRTNLTVDSYSEIVFPLNPDGSTVVTNIDSRILKSAEANNTIVATHAVSISATEDVAQWYKIDVSSGTPVLSDQGRVAAGNNTYIYYPGIDINASGAIGMTFMRSGTDSPSDFVSMWLTGRNPQDASGTMETPIIVPSGTGQATYQADGRAGDLSGINVDPTNGTFWAANEFANTESPANWGTAIANFTVAEPHFDVTFSASSVSAGQAFSVTVTAETADNQVNTAYRGTVHFTSSDSNSGVVLPGDYTFTSNDHGVHTFSGVVLATAGTQSITATDAVNNLTGTQTINVTPGATSRFVVVGPFGVQISTFFSFTVAAFDRFGNATPGYSGTIHFTTTAASSILPANSTLTNGTGTFSAALNTAGSQTITATDTINSAVTGTSNIIHVGNPATHYAISAPSTAVAGVFFSFTVTALDASNVIAYGYGGTARFTTTDPNGSVPADTGFTGGTGTASFTAILRTAGPQTIMARDTFNLSVTGTSNTINVSPGAAATFVVSAPVSTTAGNLISFTVTAYDPFNNIATGYTGTVHFTSSDGNASLPPNSTLTNGIGQFTNGATLRTAGSQTIVATDTVNALLTGQATVIVSPAAATHFSVVAPASATAGVSFSISVTAQDQFDNTATGYGGTVKFTSTDGLAVLPPNSTLTNGVGSFNATLGTHGVQTITATDTVTSSITGTSNPIGVSAGPTTHFAVVAPANTPAGSAFSFSVTALDIDNNVAFGYTGTVHFSSSDGGAILPPNMTLTNGSGIFSATLRALGNQTITATDTVTSSITGFALIVVGPGVATHFMVTAPATAVSGTAFSFMITALDQFNDTATGYLGTVHFTSTDTGAALPANSTLTNGVGTFSATLFNPGSQTITAQDQANASITGTSGSIVVSLPSNQTSGPRVVGFAPTNTVGPITSVTVTFAAPVNALTFTSASFDVFHGPGGDLSLGSIAVADIDPSSHRVFRVSFASQAAAGIYTLTFGPNVRDFAGHQMDQNNNGVSGEPDDAFTGHFVIAPHSASPELVVGADAGGGPEVKVFNEITHQKIADFYAYDSHFTGGVRVALGDINGDGIPDVITAPGASGGPDIRVWDISTGNPVLIDEFMAYSPFFTGGVFVATGDVNGDGRADILTGAGAGGGPEVKVFSGKDNSIIWDFMAYSPFFNGGVSVAAGDVNGNGYANVVTGAGPGGGPHVEVFSGKTLTLLESYYAFNPTFNGGVNVAMADVIGTGRADVVAGQASGQTLINVYDGMTRAQLASFYAFPRILVGGVRVGGISSLNGDLSQDIVAGTGPGNSPQVIAYNTSTNTNLDSFFAFDQNFLGGVYVGGS